MKDDINLLPPAVIETRTGRIYLARLGQLQRFTLSVLLVIGLALGGVYAVTWRVGTILDAQTSDALASQAELVQQVRSINEQLGAIQTWRMQHRAWTPLLPDILAVLPSELRLTELELDATTDAVTIRGVFSSREALVQFQRRLQSLPWVERIEAPLSNFQVGRDEEFTVTIFRQQKV